MLLVRRALALAPLALLPLLGGCVLVAGGALIGAGVGAGVSTAASRNRPPTLSARIEPGATLLVDFIPARDITAWDRRARDSLRVQRATRLLGAVRVVRGDTAWVAIGQLRREQGPHLEFARGHEPILQLVPDGETRTTTIAPRSSRETSIVAGGLLGAGLTIVTLYALCVVTGCLGD